MDNTGSQWPTEAGYTRGPGLTECMGAGSLTLLAECIGVSFSGVLTECIGAGSSAVLVVMFHDSALPISIPKSCQTGGTARVRTSMVNL